LRDAGEALIAAANQAGGRDNITVVLFRLEDVLAAAPAGERSATAGALAGAPAGLADTETHASAVPATGAPAAASPAATAPSVSAPTALATPPAPPVRRRRPRLPRDPRDVRRARSRARLRRARVAIVAVVVLGFFAAGAYLALQSVFFIGTNSRGLVTLYQGVPYELPGGIRLYSTGYVSGVSAAAVPPARRRTLLDHSLRSEGDAEGIVRSLELGQLSE
ncbi:MAG TPA: hypothetical protein VL972_07865, partial [Solirubrobacteraceae bacterium]|nr:hypothetical protein [Solirubrobacteraceae bacterium]